MMDSTRMQNLMDINEKRGNKSGSSAGFCFGLSTILIVCLKFVMLISKYFMYADNTIMLLREAIET